jgi:CheY-like chemotaxis protein
MPFGPTPSWADNAEAEIPAVVAPALQGRADALNPGQMKGGGQEMDGENRPARILVLEDDPMIRRLISVTLRRDGHEVVETADGYDTVRLYREAMEAGRRFDLVLSDLTIEPGLGGVETIRSLRKIDPTVLAIVSSGYSDAPAMSRPGAFGFSAVLPKPYPPRELRRVVTATLDRYAPRRSG